MSLSALPSPRKGAYEFVSVGHRSPADEAVCKILRNEPFCLLPAHMAGVCARACVCVCVCCVPACVYLRWCARMGRTVHNSQLVFGFSGSCVGGTIFHSGETTTGDRVVLVVDACAC